MLHKFAAILAVFLILALVFAELKPYFSKFTIQSDRVEVQEQIQYYLARTNRNNTAISADITKALTKLPTAARIRLSFLRLRVNGGLSYDTVYGVAKQGHDLGTFPTDQPVSDWFDYLPRLMAGQCAFIKVSNMTAAEARDRLMPLMVAFLACPIYEDSRLVGAAYASWDENADLPDAAGLKNAETVLRGLATDVGEILLKP